MADNQESSVIVVRVSAGHPTGSYSRAGHRFSTTPVAVRVNEEQRRTLEQDQFLKVYTEGDTYDTAVESGEPVDLTASNGASVQQAEVARKNEVAYASGDAVPGNENRVIDADPDAAEQTTQQQDADEGTRTKADIIEELKAQGLKEGEDFDPKAKKADLEKLLQA